MSLVPLLKDNIHLFKCSMIGQKGPSILLEFRVLQQENG